MRMRITIHLLLILSFILTGCSSLLDGEAQPILTERVAEDPLTIAELYLQEYQPGPLPRIFQSTQIFDRSGILLAELFGEGRRVWAALGTLDIDLINATIATEDKTFFINNGIDPVRVAAAAVRNFQRGEVVSGASTITMQLARNLVFTPDERVDQSLERKLEEAQLARDLTDLYSKETLLEIYLNLLNYGNLAYGPEAAAQTYFGKSAADLTLAEAAMLAGIPQQPAILNPFSNLEAVKARQRIVLNLLVRHEYTTQEEADAAFAEPLNLRSDGGQAINRAPHFVQYVLDQLKQVVGPEVDLKLLLSSGLRITTTLDLKMQTLAQQSVTDNVTNLSSVYNMSNAALVAMRPNTGEILAMVGSANFYNDAIDGQVNVATRLRQPGSAIKPLFYATAIEDNLISPATVLWDIPVSYTVDANKVYIPTNYDGKFHGPVTVRTALANSYNIPAVKLVDAVGVERMLTGARTLGVASLDKPTNWYGLSLTLGGGEVTLLDLTTGFTTLASEGRYNAPIAIRAIDSSWGQSIATDRPFAVQVISPETAFLISDILSDNNARAPMFGTNSLLRLSRPAAAKTGTTTDYKDNWTIGYTRYLVVGVWAGNNDGRPMRNTSGVTGAAPVWGSFMEGVLADAGMLATLEADIDDPTAWQFVPPTGVTLRTECPPGMVCRAGGGEYFSQRWLDQSGISGPLADSVELVQSAPVFVQQGDQSRRAGYCVLPNGTVRPLLKVRNRLGLPDPSLATAPLSTDEVITDTDIFGVPDGTTITEIAEVAVPTPVPDLAEIGETPRLSNNELGQVVSWALRYSVPVNLGRCEELKQRIPQALIGIAGEDQPDRVLVDTLNPSNEVTDTVASDAVEVITIEAIGLPTATPEGQAFAGAPSVYMPTSGVIHDKECAGQYVLGQILNRDGVPIPGVRIFLRDQWGNQYEAVSKSGATDTGSYDFPIYSYSPHELYLTVVDGSGGALSPTLTIQHLLGEGLDATCHRVSFRGG